MIKFGIGQIKNHAILARDFLFDLFFPIFCLNCGREGSYLCPECFSFLDYRESYHCLKCKKPNLEYCLCPKCLPDYHIDNILIAGNYDNKILSDLIKNLKYRFAEEIANILGNYLSNYLVEKSRLEFENIIIMPVPLHKKRLRWRGFNQSEKIAEIIAENLNLEINGKDLIRVKNKKPQAKLNEEQRRKNIKNCFEFAGNRLDKKNIILIDDVVTTGSTLDECARVLKENGARKVWGLVAANG